MASCPSPSEEWRSVATTASIPLPERVKEEGHGLGMMIVERIMREHGGHINIESRKEAGTAITLQFPQQHRRTRLLE